MNARGIEIIGGGLAGLALGNALQQHGVPTTIFEAGDYPRHRVCGEFMTGLPRRTGERLKLSDVLDHALLHHEVAWFLRDEPTHVEVLPEPALGISRHTLDAQLAETFVAAGGTLRTRTRVPAGQSIPGRVFATGRRAGRSPWIGLKMHVRGLALARDLELHLGDRAYVGLCRVDSEQVNVCGLFHRRSLSRRGPPLLVEYLHAAGLARLAERIGEAQVEPNSFCAVAALAFDRRFVPTARLRLGDAAAVVPPFTGNGMAMALQSAEIALDPLLAYARGELAWPDAVRQINRALRRRFRVRLASAGMLHAFLLQPRRQRCLAALARTHLLPWRPLYEILH